MAEEFDEVNGRFVDVASDNEVDSGDVSEDGVSQPKPKEDPWANVDLDEIPSFRKYKSTMDKKLRMGEETAAQERRQREQLQRQYEQDRMNSLDSGQKAVYRAELAERRAAELAERIELQEAADRRGRVLAEMAEEAGIPVDAIADAEDPVDALRRAVKYLKASGRQPESTASTERERAANRVDIGRGAPLSAAGDYQRQYDSALKEHDTWKMLDIMAEADKAGVRLKE